MKYKALLCLIPAVLIFAGCGGRGAGPDETPGTPAASLPNDTAGEISPAETPAEDKIPMEESEMKTITLKINDTEVAVQWEENDSVAALRGLLENGPMEVKMSMYGGFEQVGSLGQSLTRNDVQTVTGPGDIVLYSGNSIVVFYGSNSWAYTRLGKIIELTQQELTQLLGNGDVVLTLAIEG